MISRRNRFHGHGSLQTIYRKGRQVRGEVLGLRFMTSTQPTYRCAVVVSKKISKLAVRRNRLRRLIYETTRQALGQNTRSYDLVFTVINADALQLSSEKIATETKKLLAKAGLVSPDRQGRAIINEKE